MRWVEARLMTESGSNPVRVSHRWVACAVAFVAALTITLAALRSSDQDQSLVVTVDDGAETVTENLSTTYRVGIANHTDRRLDQLEVALTTPSSLVPGRAAGGEAQGPTETRWLVDVDPGATAQVDLSVVAGTASTGSDITVIACASGAGEQSACAADVNRWEPAAEAGSGVGWLTALLMWCQFLLAAPVVLLVVFAAFRRRRTR